MEKPAKKDNTYCCVPQCKSRGSKDPELSFHMFPNEKSKCVVFVNGKKALASRRTEWKRILRIGKDISPRMTVCSKHFKTTDFTRSTFQRPRLNPSAVPSCFLPVPSTEGHLQNNKATGSRYGKINKTPKGKKESSKMVKRKSAASEASNKKLNNSSKLNGAHSSNGVEASRKSTDSNSKMTDKPMCTNPEAFAFLNIPVKKEPLFDEDTPSDPSKNNLEENIPENVQITNVRSLTSERNIPESPSSELNTSKRSDEGLDSDFYSKPLDMDERDKAFGSFVACELSDLRVNPALYMKTKQSILKLLTEGHFEKIMCCKKS